MNQKGFAKITLTILVVILAGVLVYLTLIKKTSFTDIKDQVSTSKQNNLATSQNNAIPSSSLPATCEDESHAPGGKDLPPVITSISPTSGSLGTKVEIRGCNLAGFEGDQIAIFERSDGKKLTFYGSGYNEKEMTVILGDNCPTGSETGRNSGIISPCETIKALPGTYNVYVITWGEDFRSNLATFTIKK